MQFEIEPEIVFPGLIHLHFKTQYEVASSFMRLQEFYESSYDSVQGHVFTLEHYMDKYAYDTGNFTYTSDWSGFNVPGSVIDNFFELFSTGGLLQKETTLLDVIKQARDKDWKEYYVIGSSADGGKRNDQRDVMKHEIAHGMWYLNKEYNEEQRKIVRQINEEYVDIGEKLIEMGYSEGVLDDEIHAYIATSSMSYLADDGFEGCDIPWGLVLDSQRLFEKYYESLTDE